MRCKDRTEATAALDSLRDALRSARRWQELISEDERRRLLTDIARVALAAGQDIYPERGVNDLDIGSGGAADSCPRERLSFLMNLWPRLSGALTAIEAAPHAVPVPRTQAVPLEKARRVAPMALLAALRSGDFVPALPPGKSRLAKRLEGRLPRRIREIFPALCRDTPENRAIKACLVYFARDLAAIAGMAEAVQASDAAREAAHLRARLRSHLRRAPWRDLPLPPPAIPAQQQTPTLRAHPHYRFVMDAYRRYRQAFRFDWNNPIFTLPARETWLLYEYWGFFQVVDALRALGCRVTRADDFALNRSGLTFSLAQGTASRLTFITPDGGQTLTLTYNRTFALPATNNGGAGEGWHSRSYAMRPDITLEASGRLLIFDTKFKTYAESGWESDDIRQMHAYRDAITQDGRRGVVAQAWLLYPGRVQGENRAVIAYPAATAERPFGSGDVGALLARPGGQKGGILQIIGRFLGF